MLHIYMKVKFGFFKTLLLGLDALLPVLVAFTIIIPSFCHYLLINKADAMSFLESSFSSVIQSQQSHQQQAVSNINGISLTISSNKLELIHQQLPITVLSLSLSTSQQQHNRVPSMQEQESFNTDGVTSDRAGNHVSGPKSLKPFYTNFPDPTCYFTLSPVFCPHFLWALK
jgi:hypothetical protein